jgi:hypothetical protein
MAPRTEIINNRIVNSVELLASFLKPGDIFRKLRGRTQYKFLELMLTKRLVVCENLDTHVSEEIYFNSPVFKLLFI